MKFKRNLLIFSAILVAILILVSGCVVPPTTETSIIIAGDDSVTNDSTPTLTILAVGAAYMAFSGNGTTWSDWVAYATTYSTFNITTGAGCTTGDGTKTVYAKFKNIAGTVFGECNDSITYDTTGPKLSTAVYTDFNSSGTINTGDTITFTFDDAMDTSTITSSNLSTRLVLSSGNYGSSPTVSWSSSKKVCEVTLGTSPTIVSGTTVNPASTVTDVAGNVDISSAVTITGFTTVLYSVSISPPTATATVGTASSQTFTASALSIELVTMTSSCTFIWSISPTSGRGSLSATSGTTVTYTLPATGVTAGTATITVYAVKTGTTTPVKTATATVTVSAAPAASAVLTGTVITGAPNTEANIVAGGKTIIITLTNDKWIAGTGVGGFNYAIADANTIIDGLTTTTDPAEWAKVITELKQENNGTDNTAVVRTSATVLTITLPATAGYDISASQNQTVTMTVPAASVVGASPITATPVFTITADVASAVLSGTVTAATEEDIRTGGKIIIITLTNDTWIAATGTGSCYLVADANTIIDGLVAATETAEWAKVITELKQENNGTDNTAVVRTSDTVLTITLPATAGYNISANQTITMTVPAASVIGVSPIPTTPEFTITAV